MWPKMRIMKTRLRLSGRWAASIILVVWATTGSLWAQESRPVWLAAEDIHPVTQPQITEPAVSQDPTIEDFFSTDDSLEDLPPALDENGNPLGDAPPLLEEPEIAEPEGEKESWIRREGYLEYHGTYSTNIDLSAPGIDFDLRRKRIPNAQAIRETEVSDWINGVEMGYIYEVPILPEVMKAAVRYHLEQDYFSDENREERTQQTFELASIQRLTDQIEWEVYGGYEYENRNDNAQYLTPDYDQWHIGTEVRQTIDEGTYLTLGYEFRKRDYESLSGGFPVEDTPWKDWNQHRAWIRYDRDLLDQLTLNLRLLYETRDHSSEALTDTGRALDDTCRQYDLWEPRAGLTYRPTDQDWIRVYYRLRSLASTGEYYDYEQNSVTVQYIREVCPGLVFRSEFEYANRDYGDQKAYSDNKVVGIQTQKDEVREDDRISLYFAVEKTVAEVWTTGIDYTYLNNDSNDDSSRYQEDRYGVFARREF